MHPVVSPVHAITSSSSFSMSCTFSHPRHRYSPPDSHLVQSVTRSHASLSSLPFCPQLQIIGYNSDLYQNMSDASNKANGLTAIALLIQVRIYPIERLFVLLSVYRVHPPSRYCPHARTHQDKGMDTQTRAVGPDSGGRNTTDGWCVCVCARNRLQSHVCDSLVVVAGKESATRCSCS